mgnify:FL=1
MSRERKIRDLSGEWNVQSFEEPNYTRPPCPDHYQQGSIELVDFFLASPHLGWCEANAIKYLYRWRKKGGLRDLEKAMHYIQLLIEREEAGSGV